MEKTLESPLDYEETQPVHPKEDQSWVFFGRNDAKAETPVVGGQREELPPMAKVMRKEAWHTQRRDQASGNPLFPSI